MAANDAPKPVRLIIEPDVREAVLLQHVGARENAEQTDVVVNVVNILIADIARRWGECDLSLRTYRFGSDIRPEEAPSAWRLTIDVDANAFEVLQAEADRHGVTVETLVRREIHEQTWNYIATEPAVPAVDLLTDQVHVERAISRRAEVAEVLGEGGKWGGFGL